MLTRKATPLIALLTLALTLLAASALALACGPAAPPAQGDAPPTQDNTPAAAEPTATATPTPEPGVTPELAVVAQAVYRLAEQQQNRGPSGASGTDAGPQLPERIYVYVTAWTEDVDDLERMLQDNGATDISVINDGIVSVVESQAPPTTLPDITRHPAFIHAFTDGIYPNMEQSLDNELTMYASGIQTAAKTARDVMRGLYFPNYPENIIVKIELDAPASYAAVHDFLAARDAFPHDIEPGASWFYAGVPVAIMDELYSYQGVRYIDRYPRTLDFGVGPASSMPVPGPWQAASNRRQGANVHGALAWNSIGNTGQDVVVGIIDQGFMGFASLMGTELPAPTPAAKVHYSCYNPMTSVSKVGMGTPDASTCAITSSHGTMVAEAVYDIAPGATLYVSNDHTNEAADWMIENGVDIINHSRGSQWDGPGNGTSNIALSSLKTVENAVSNGVLWVNAAGNYAQTSWFKRGIGVNQTARGNFIQFDGTDDCNDVSLEKGNLYDFQLRWAGKWDGSNDDLSVQVWRKVMSGVDGGQTVTVLTLEATSNNVQLRSTVADTDPYDDLSYEAGASETYCLRVQVPGRTAPDWIQVRNTTKISLQYNGDGQSIAQPGDSREAGMLTVGAAYWRTTSDIQSSSSVGPTRDGRIKPDIVGADGAYAGVDGKAAFGTSQAAPHVAGLAALLLKRHPKYTPELLAYFLKSNAEPRTANPAPHNTDPNNLWGHGFARLPSPTATPVSPTKLVGTGGNRSVTLSWNEAANATGYVVEQWDGRANPARFRELPFTESGGTYNRTYTYKLTGAGAEIGNLVNGVSYAHRIKSTNGTHNSGLTNWIVTRTVSPLSTPSGLRGTSRHRAVSLDWNDVPGATGYRIQQWDGRARGWRILPFRESHLNYNYSIDIDFDDSSARIGNLTNGVTYSHRLQAIKGDEASAWTAWVNTTARGIAGDSGAGGTAGQVVATPPPPTSVASDGASGQSDAPQGDPTPPPPMPQNEPSGLTARQVDGAVVLYWMPGTNPNYVKQVVKRREAGVRPEVWTDFELDISAHTYTDRTAESGKTYIYRIKGLRDNGRGGTSNRVTVTTR